jgi:hypothetical protein
VTVKVRSSPRGLAPGPGVLAFRALAATLAFWAPELALARGDHTIVPGLFGYNALPAIPNADPVVEDHVLLELSAAAQLADLTSARDAAATPYARLVIPFRGLVALEIDGTPVEWWRVSPEMQQRIGAQSSHGVDLGDMRFGARFSICPEGDRLPAMGVRFITKTTTGKGFENRRFTDAPAYVVDALFGKDLPVGLGASAGLRLLTKIGFMAWQQGSDWQDDALDFGATLQVRSGATRLEVEWRGYWGYEQQDKPQLIGLTFGHRIGSVDWVATVNRGLTGDAPPWELRAGVIMHFGASWDAPAQPPEPSPSPSGLPP